MADSETADHSSIPIWNAETSYYEDLEVGSQIKSIKRTVSEGEVMLFNALVLDMHPYVADEMFASKEGMFGRRIVPGALVFSVGLGLVATNNVNAFSYGYDRLRFVKPVFIGDTIFTVRTILSCEPKYPDLGVFTASYEIFNQNSEVVLYTEHIQTILYKPTADHGTDNT